MNKKDLVGDLFNQLRLRRQRFTARVPNQVSAEAAELEETLGQMLMVLDHLDSLIGMLNVIKLHQSCALMANDTALSSLQTACSSACSLCCSIMTWLVPDNAWLCVDDVLRSVSYVDCTSVHQLVPLLPQPDVYLP